MIVDSEKTAQSMPTNTGPRFPPLAVVCNGLLSIAKREWRAASIAVETALVRKGDLLAGASGVLWEPSIETGILVGVLSQPSRHLLLKDDAPGTLPCRDLADSWRRTNHS